MARLGKTKRFPSLCDVYMVSEESFFVSMRKVENKLVKLEKKDGKITDEEASDLMFLIRESIECGEDFRSCGRGARRYMDAILLEITSIISTLKEYSTQKSKDALEKLTEDIAKFTEEKYIVTDTRGTGHTQKGLSIAIERLRSQERKVNWWKKKVEKTEERVGKYIEKASRFLGRADDGWK